MMDKTVADAKRGTGDAPQQGKTAKEEREPGAGGVSKGEYERIKKEAVTGLSG